MMASDIRFEIPTFDTREHALQFLADTRRRQLESACAGNTAESAAHAQVAATIRALIDEFESVDCDDLQACRESLSTAG